MGSIASRDALKKSIAFTEIRKADRPARSIIAINAFGTALFWVITQRVVVIPYRCFGTNFFLFIFSFGCLTAVDGADKLSRNVGKKLSLLAV
jgi:hypothetical protein